MITLPHDISWEVAGCCADSLEFRSLVNVALISRSIYAALKMKLKLKTMVRTVDAIVELAERCRLHFPEERATPSKFQKVRYVMWTQCVLVLVLTLCRWWNSFLILPCIHVELSTIAHLARKKLFPRLEFLVVLKMSGGLPMMWEMTIIDKLSLCWSATNLAASLEAVLHHKFRLGGQGYDAEKMIEKMNSPAWQPRHLLPFRMKLPKRSSLDTFAEQRS
jgi:hypothetical protein